MPLFRGRMLAREGPPLLLKTFMRPHSVSSVVVLARRSASARSSAARCRAFISRNDARCSRLETRPRLRVTPPRAICSADALALVSDVGGNGPPFLIKSLYNFINLVKYSVVHSSRKKLTGKCPLSFYQASSRCLQSPPCPSDSTVSCCSVQLLMQSPRRFPRLLQTEAAPEGAFRCCLIYFCRSHQTRDPNSNHALRLFQGVHCRPYLYDVHHRRRRQRTSFRDFLRCCRASGERRAQSHHQLLTLFVNRFASCEFVGENM